MQIPFSLTSRLVLLALLAASPGVAIQVWNELDLRQTRSQAVREQVLLAAQNQLSEIDRIAEGAEGVLVALAEIPQIRNADKEPGACNALLSRIRANYQSYLALIVADLSGSVACSSIGPGPGIADRLYFRNAVERREFSTGEFVQGRGTHKAGFHFSYPLRNDAGQVTGVIAAALDLDWFAARMAARLPSGASLLVADVNGTVLVGLPNNHEKQGHKLPDTLRDAFSANVAGVDTFAVDGEEVILAYIPGRASKIGLFVAVSRERASAFADLQRTSNRSTALILAGLALALVTAWLWGIYGIRSPVQRLLTIAQNWRAGRYLGSGMRWGRSEIGQLGRTFDELAQTVADREQRLRDSQARLQDREGYLSAVLDRVPVGIMQTDPQKRYVFVNRTFCQIVGRRPEEMIGRTFDEFTHPDDLPYNEALFNNAIAKGESYSLRKRYLRPQGDPVWIEVTVAPLGPPSRDFLAVAVDLTERIAAEEQQELLIHELNHRVKNTLASVQSLARMTMRYTDTKEAFYRAFTERMLALSATHNLLTSGRWRGASLRDVIESELRPYSRGAAARVALSGGDVALTPHQAINLGMMMHELTTNAAKHGALATGGHVRVAWREEAGKLRIEWAEAGAPVPTRDARRGFGSRLIEQTAKALGGEVSVQMGESGLQCTIVLPLRS